MNGLTVVGLIAGTLTTISFIPQVMMVVRTRRTKDISLGMFVLFNLGIALWLVYGLMLHDWPVIIANCITLVLALVILGFKLRYH